MTGMHLLQIRLLTLLEKTMIQCKVTLTVLTKNKWLIHQVKSILTYDSKPNEEFWYVGDKF